ncbi:MAG: hypothetical protein HWE23_11255 [Rhodobacteraceae bacterium]|nr:hypothetical protein [Paracoccaceae bacterium]
MFGATMLFLATLLSATLGNAADAAADKSNASVDHAAKGFGLSQRTQWAKFWPNWFTHWRMFSRLTASGSSARRSSTSVVLSTGR